MRTKTGHMHFDDITKLINGRPGIRFSRVAWGADLWLEYVWFNPCDVTPMRVVLLCNGAKREPAYEIGGKDKRDWRVMQGLDGRIPEL